MASGERYDIYSFTAAHRKFPFGTLLKVTNLLNRKSVMVRVEDRGPFAKNRVIDLSYAAADELGFIRRGVANVEVKEMIVRKEYLQSMTLPEKPVLIGNCRNPDNIKPVLGRFL
jgi:rare lipoprotein A